jgi:RimJ/RimL family protein N-acetyltransferase
MKFARAVKLQGRKVNLCPINKKDIPLFHQWVSDLTVTKTLFSGTADVLTVYDEEDWFKKTKKREGELTLAIVAKKFSKTIGSIELKRINKIDKTASLGIIIGDKNYWGKGYGREAITLLLDFAFNVLNLHSVNLSVYDYNHRAIKAYQAVGFKEAGRLRETRFWGGKYYDIIKMDILADEFKNSKIKDLILEAQRKS